MGRNNALLTVVSVIIIFVFLFIVYAASNNTNSSSETVFPELTKASSTDHVKWGTNQKNILTEFSDFQCPACGSFHQILKNYEASGSAEAKVASKITFVYKNYPLEKIHKNARVAAYAAEAAGLQGKFFEMSDMLFENQKVWAESKDINKTFLEYANIIKLDIEKYKKDVTSSEVKKRVDDDLILGNQVGLNSTPTFYLNGKKLEFTTLDQFQKLLADAVK